MGSGSILILNWSPLIDERPVIDHFCFSSFVSDGRLRFHSCMCSCCSTVNGKRLFTFNCEPIPINAFNDSYQLGINTISQAKGKLLRTSGKTVTKVLESLLQFIHSSPCGTQIPLCINPRSPSFREFLQSTTAQPAQLSQTPLPWEWTCSY